MSNILIWFQKSKLDEWSDEAGADYEDDNKKTSEEVSDEDEVQDGNANEDEVKVGGGMPEMPTKMPAPEKMNDQEKWCANILAPFLVCNSLSVLHTPGVGPSDLGKAKYSVTALNKKIFPHQSPGHWQADRADQQVVWQYDPVHQQHEGVPARGQGEEEEEVAEGEEEGSEVNSPN